jgi:hypothetical protein
MPHGGTLGALPPGTQPPLCKIRLRQRAMGYSV